MVSSCFVFYSHIIFKLKKSKSFVCVGGEKMFIIISTEHRKSFLSESCDKTQWISPAHKISWNVTHSLILMWIYCFFFLACVLPAAMVISFLPVQGHFISSDKIYNFYVKWKEGFLETQNVQLCSNFLIFIIYQHKD